MSNILIVLAHPSKESLNHAIAQTIQEQKEKKGHAVTLLDLYNDHTQDFLRFDNLEDITADKQTLYHQDLISKADELFFVFPYWWGSEPAILHNWLDCNLISGFAFSYSNKGRPTGLLTGKKVSIFTTSGTPNFLYVISGGYRWLKRRWQKGIINFCGMELSSFYAFGWIDSSEEKAAKVLQKVQDIASN